jgi:LacI family transcriptional regulator
MSYPTRVTLMDVARAAGVSRSTAARVLGGYGNVEADLRRSVLAAATALGYRSNTLARSVSSGRSHTLGVVVSDIENPYFARAVRGISDVARKAEFDVILANTDEKIDAERAAVEVFLNKRVDGLIVAPSSGTESEHLRAVQAMARPLVLLDRSLPDLDCDWVGTDSYRAAVDVVSYLAKRGHERIAFVTATSRSAVEIETGRRRPLSTIADRSRGIRDASTEHGVNYQLLPGAMSWQRTLEIVTAALAQPRRPTALIASSSGIALAAFHTLRDAGLGIPDEVALVSLDDAQWMDVSAPRITAVTQPTYDLGTRAAEVLIARIAGDGPAETNHVLPVTFTERASVALRR